MNAAQALKRLKTANAVAISNMLEACLSYNGRLSGPCCDVLKELKKDSTLNSMLQAEIAKLSQQSQEQLTKLGLRDAS